MATRLRAKHQEDVRHKIQTSQLINRLQNHVFGEVELTQTQLRAAEILLKKRLPDLSAVAMEANVTQDADPADLDRRLKALGVKL